MIIVKIKRRDGSHRFLRLGVGEHVFGSGLDCDYILLDPGVEKRHFILSVAKDNLRFAFFSEQGNLLPTIDDPHLHWHPLLSGGGFPLGELEITFFGPSKSAADVSQNLGNPAISSAQIASNLGPLLTFVTKVPILVWGVALMSVISTSITFALPTKATLDVAGNPIPIEHQAKLMIEKQKVVKRHVQTPGVSRAAKSLSADVSSSVQPDALNEAKRVLESFDIRVEDISMQGPLLRVSGMVPDTQLREKVSSTLVDDISSISRVSFQYAPDDEWHSFKTDILAVWSGERPYIVLKGDGLIRLGEPFRNHFVLRDVSRHAISVSVGGSIQEIRL